MRKEIESYDTDLQMFREPPQPLNLAHLRFLRWLAEHGQLEHAPAGPPTGMFAQGVPQALLAPLA